MRKSLLKPRCSKSCTHAASSAANVSIRPRCKPSPPCEQAAGSRQQALASPQQRSSRAPLAGLQQRQAQRGKGGAQRDGLGAAGGAAHLGQHHVHRLYNIGHVRPVVVRVIQVSGFNLRRRSCQPRAHNLICTTSRACQRRSSRSQGPQAGGRMAGGGGLEDGGGQRRRGTAHACLKTRAAATTPAHKTPRAAVPARLAPPLPSPPPPRKHWPVRHARARAS